jgi:hypothetical protein
LNRNRIPFEYHIGAGLRSTTSWSECQNQNRDV